MHRLHVVTGTCRHHFGCLQYPSTSTYLGHLIPLFGKLENKPLSRRWLIIASERQKLKHKIWDIFCPNISGSKDWNRTSRYLRWNREWRVLAKRDSQTHDTPLKTLCQFASSVGITFESLGFSHIPKTEKVCFEDLIEYWNFPFHQKEGVRMICFPRYSKAIDLVQKG